MYAVKAIYDGHNFKLDESVPIEGKYEVLKGFRWRKNITKETMFKNFLETISVFTIDNDVTALAADIYADLRRIGKIIGDADILIAAIIIKNDLEKNIKKMGSSGCVPFFVLYHYLAFSYSK
jgi:hypothetical protein